MSGMRNTTQYGDSKDSVGLGWRGLPWGLLQLAFSPRVNKLHLEEG